MPQRITAFLFLTALIAALVKHEVEQAYRKNFLESALLAELAARDGLTDLMNRRAFDEHMLRDWQQAPRDQAPDCCVRVAILHEQNVDTVR